MHFNSNGCLERINYIDSNVYSVQFNSLIKTNGNELVFTGSFSKNTDFYVRLVKTGLNGKEHWRKIFGFGYADEGKCVRQTSDSGFIIIGKTEVHNSRSDIYIIKTDKNGYANPPVAINSLTSNIPQKLELNQNYPNPFNPVTNLEFSISKTGFVSLKIYDVLGKEIRTLVNEIKQPGIYKVEFDGSSLSSGVYFYKIEAGSFVQTKRMLLLK